MIRRSTEDAERRVVLRDLHAFHVSATLMSACGARWPAATAKSRRDRVRVLALQGGAKIVDANEALAGS